MTQDIENDVDETSLIETAGEAVGEFLGNFDGIPKPLKKGFLKACNQLGTAWLEGKAIEIKATSEARALMTKGIATKMLETGEIPEEYTQLAIEQQSRKIVRKRLNLDKILQRTKGYLEKSKEENIRDQPDEVSEDWLNTFEDIAENMSSEEMQMRFAKILAGEIKQPSSFSIKSVKILSEIDTKTANLFARLCGCCIILKIPTYGNAHVLDARISALSGSIGSNSLQQYGLSYDQITRLQEYDLVSSELNSNMPYRSAIVSPISTSVQMPFYYQNKAYALRQLEDDENQRKNFKMSGVRLTAVGIELYSIVDFVANEKYFADFKAYLDSQKLRLEPVKL